MKRPTQNTSRRYRNMEFGISFFVTLMPIVFVTSQLKVVEEIGVPGENHRLTPSHWQLSHVPMPGCEKVARNMEGAMETYGPEKY